MIYYKKSIHFQFSHYTLSSFLLQTHPCVVVTPVQHLRMSVFPISDVDECAHPALRQCSPHADCNNTVGSYYCTCHQGYMDVDPSNPGANCTGLAVCVCVCVCVCTVSSHRILHILVEPMPAPVHAVTIAKRGHTNY